MIQRNSYLNKLIQVKGNGFPKVITGIRRCGKSYLLMELFKNHLIESGVDEKTRLREIKPYISLNDQIQKIVVINRPIKEMRDKDGYIVVGLAEFLLKIIK